ncbi:MAG: sialate O-acetylesterase [Verrucomicrobiota bacterium]
MVSRLLLVLWLSAVAEVGADLRLPAIWSDRMVLQHGGQAVMRGWAKPASQVVVKASWAEAPLARVPADAEGRWAARFSLPEAYGGPHQVTVQSGKESLVLREVLIGEVWLCAGQSNMRWPMKKLPSHRGVLSQAQDPQLRLFGIPQVAATRLHEDFGGEWLKTRPETLAHFSAVAYYFGKRLREELGVPVGLVRSAWGGTPAEAWVSSEGLAGFPEFQERIQRILETPDDWHALKQEMKSPHREPTVLFNGMIAPLRGLPFEGVLWYQGESNVGRAEQYERLFPALIRDWRRYFASEELAFYFVQLAPYRYQGDSLRESALLREAQGAALALPATGMAVALDLGERKEIHPKGKDVVGQRLAGLALANNYGRALAAESPRLDRHEVEGESMRLFFQHADQGLVASSGGLARFEVAGEDRAFHPAEAELDGSTVLVRSGKVAQPVAVRYAFTNWTEATLFNQAGLPAPSFRTDDWPE